MNDNNYNELNEEVAPAPRLLVDEESKSSDLNTEEAIQRIREQQLLDQ